MRLELKGYWYTHEGDNVLCKSGLVRIFGRLPDRIGVIISKRPLKGSKCFHRKPLDRVARGVRSYGLRPVAIRPLDELNVNGRFYVRIEPCD